MKDKIWSCLNVDLLHYKGCMPQSNIALMLMPRFEWEATRLVVENALNKICCDEIAHHSWFGAIT